MNKVYVEIATFDEYWLENKCDNLYYHHSGRPNHIGSEDVFRCRYYNKSGVSGLLVQDLLTIIMEPMLT